MKIVAEPEKGEAESTLCDVVRMAEIMKNLMTALSEHDDWAKIPEGLAQDIENVVLTSWHLRDMCNALKVEYYAEFERHTAKRKAAAA